MRWEQVRAILWLRWRLSANRLVHGGPLNTALSIFILALLTMGAAAAALGGFLGGLLALGKAAPTALVVTWDVAIVVFLFIWMIGLMVEIQRSESIDISKLLHLPVSPSQVFAFNYLASHLTPLLIIFVPGALGLCAGLALSAGPSFSLLAGVLGGFLFMLTSWTYCLRGWLAALLVNKRRRRAVIVWITVGFIAVSQVPNLVFNSNWFRARTRSGPKTVLRTGPAGGLVRDDILKAHLLLPPGWIAYSAVMLKAGKAGPALGLTVAGGLIGLLGLLRAYSLTLRFYRGAEPGGAVKKVRAPRAKPRGGMLVERSLPGVRDDTAALALATFRGLLRAPELKMAFITPLVFIVVFGGLGLRRAAFAPPEFVGVLAATGAAILASFSFAPTMANTFGLDRDGFRALVLLPTPRHQLLLAKNLAFFPFILGTAILMLVAAALVLKSGALTVLAGLLQVPAAFLLFCLICNLTAIFAPYRFSPGTLQAKKPKAVVFIANLLIFCLMPVVSVPLAVAPALEILFHKAGWSGGRLASLLAAAVLCAAACLFYRRLLPAQGRLLQAREQSILRAVTEENE